MKTISIKQLHAETGRWVRAARKQTIIVTDRGEESAVLGPAVTVDAPRAVLNPGQRRQWMPATPLDSTRFIAEDRDTR